MGFSKDRRKLSLFSNPDPPIDHVMVTVIYMYSERVPGVPGVLGVLGVLLEYFLEYFWTTLV